MTDRNEIVMIVAGMISTVEDPAGESPTCQVPLADRIVTLVDGWSSLRREES